MATTPPSALRARTPPTPLHGPQYDTYEPYSPRRSTRSTAQNNPYGSLNTARSPKSDTQRTFTPPPTVKRARFAHLPTQLSSPPSSPASPVRHRSPRHLHKTPRKSPFVSRSTVNGALSDSDQASSSLACPTVDFNSMLPTPSKTPKKRQTAALNSAARILNFQQPHDPNDVMPSSRKMKKPVRHHVADGFELYDEEVEASGEGIQIFTDANARVPEVDDADDNPFIGRKKVALRSQRTSRRAPAENESSIEEAVRNHEGVLYNFRGKKIFRKFQDADEEQASSAATDLSDAPSQRRLKRQAGVAAQRPLTRSAIKPRLLFPSEEQLAEREENQSDVDEEALTDIEMHVASSSKMNQAATANLKTPSKERLKLGTPPRTNHATRSKDKHVSAAPETPVLENEPEPMSISTTDSTLDIPKRKTKSPFESWPRTKSGRKREAEVVEKPVGSTKRTRAVVAASPA